MLTGMNERKTRSKPPRPTGGLTARQAALRVLSDQAETGQNGRQLLETMIEQGLLPPRERPLAYELVMGVLRHRLTLSHILGLVASRKWSDVDPLLQQVLMLGAYQLIWLDGIPAFASVSETVGLVKAGGGRGASRFVNALLRELQRRIEHLRIGEEDCVPVRSLQVGDGRYCQFREPILPDPARNPVDYLALSTSHPQSLVAGWVECFGVEAARKICLAGLCRPPMILRPNPMKTNAQSLVDRLDGEGVEAAADVDGLAVQVVGAVQLTSTACYAEGVFQPQDRTAMGVVRAMNPRSGQTIIDLCAGVGTKSTQAAELMGDEGCVLASDQDRRRLGALERGCKRLGLSCVRTVHIDDIESAVTGLGQIDWILVDVPCSNTGVLARRPEARYRFNRRSVQMLADLQLELLERAERLVTEGTRLAYSTCSLEPVENEDVIKRFCEKHHHWELSGSQRTFPSGDPADTPYHDGGYWALLDRG